MSLAQLSTKIGSRGKLLAQLPHKQTDTPSNNSKAFSCIHCMSLAHNSFSKSSALLIVKIQPVGNVKRACYPPPFFFFSKMSNGTFGVSVNQEPSLTLSLTYNHLLSVPTQHKCMNRSWELLEADLQPAIDIDKSRSRGFEVNSRPCPKRSQVQVKAKWTGHNKKRKKLVTENTSRKYNLK